MKKERVSFLRLISELDSDNEILDELWEKYNLINKKIETIEPDEFDWVALGYTIHNVYNLFENYFLRISKFFENDLDKISWHKDLLGRMTLEIKDVRPRLFSRQDAQKIGELRAFRHVFRYIYQSELDSDKLVELNRKIPSIIDDFRKAHHEFVENLQIIADEI